MSQWHRHNPELIGTEADPAVAAGVLPAGYQEEPREVSDYDLDILSRNHSRRCADREACGLVQGWSSRVTGRPGHLIEVPHDPGRCWKCGAELVSNEP